MKFTVAALMHVTNTYAVEVTGFTEHHHFTVKHGSKLLQFAGMGTFTGGIIDECNRSGIEILPLISAIAPPSGTIKADVYLEFRETILKGLRDNPDMEGDLITAIREVVGPTLPVTAALDLHGNISCAMATQFTALFGNHLYAHTDSADRGAEAASAAVDAVNAITTPVTELVSLPILLQSSTTDEGFPAPEMNKICRTIESRPGVIDCTVFHGFPYTDTADVGVHVVCTTDNDRALAQACANEVAQWIWDSRERFTMESHTPDSAMLTTASLIADGKKPIVINDTSDHPGGGTPGDDTHLLGAMIEHQIPGSAFAMLCDPTAVQEAIKAGVGNTIELTIGGRHGPLHGPPLKVAATIRSITDGRMVLTHMMRGYPLNLGPAVGIKVGEVDIILRSHPQQTFDTEIFKLDGIDTSQSSVVGLQSSTHFRAGFNHIATDILRADSPGLTTLDVTTSTHPAHPGKLWPTDPDTEWPQT